MTSPSDDSFERTRSPPTKLRPPTDHRHLTAAGGRASPGSNRAAASPSPRRTPSPNAASHLIPTATPRSRESAAGRKEKGSSRVLAELADLRAQLEAHARSAVMRTQELAAAQQEIGALKAELRRRDVLSSPTKLQTEVNRLSQENAMVLEYLDKSMEEIQKHKEAHHQLLQLQADQQRHSQDLQSLAAQREAQLEQASARCAELERDLSHAVRRADEKECQLEQLDEQRRTAEAALAAAHREYADLQAIQDELLDSLQAAQSELQRHQQPPVAASPPSLELMKIVQRNTDALQQQQAMLQEVLRHLHPSDARTAAWLHNNTDLTIGSLADDGDVSRAAGSLLPAAPRRTEPAPRPTMLDAASQCTPRALLTQGTQTVAPVSSSSSPSATEQAHHAELAAACQEIARLQAQLEAAQQEHQIAASVYERELQHLRVQQEMQLCERVDRQCYESLQRSYELSEARGRLLNASLTLYSTSEEPPGRLVAEVAPFRAMD